MVTLVMGLLISDPFTEARPLNRVKRCGPADVTCKFKMAVIPLVSTCHFVLHAIFTVSLNHTSVFLLCPRPIYLKIFSEKEYYWALRYARVNIK